MRSKSLAHRFADEHGKENAEEEDGEDDGQGDKGRNLPFEELTAYHLHSDEGEQHPEAVMQHPEAVGHIAQEEEERTQAHDGEDIGGVDNDRILGHGEDGRYGVDCEDDVAELNH